MFFFLVLGYISQTVKLGALGIPSYRPFSLEELEEATNRFQASAFFDEGSHGKVEALIFSCIYFILSLKCLNNEI